MAHRTKVHRAQAIAVRDIYASTRYMWSSMLGVNAVADADDDVRRAASQNGMGLIT